MRKVTLHEISLKPGQIRLNQTSKIWGQLKNSLWMEETVNGHLLSCCQPFWMVAITIITTRMHSRRLRTARSSSHPGGLHQAPPWEQTPPEKQTPWEQTPCKACWDTTCHECWDSTPPCNACWDSTPPVKRMTNRCKNITLPQTSFVGRKNDYHGSVVQNIIATSTWCQEVGGQSST